MTDVENPQQKPTKNFQNCRICGEESEHGEELFNHNQAIQRLAVKICSFISIKLRYIWLYPNWICPGCHLQLQSTEQFLELIKNGQRILIEKFGEPKRGRKPKTVNKKELVTGSAIPCLDVATVGASQNEDEGKRAIKTPGRLQDSMQGNELEDLYSKMGIIKRPTRHVRQSKTKFIARIENQEGAALGEMLAIESSTHKTCTRYQCEICKESFTRDKTFFQHVAEEKHNVLYECTECEKNFPNKEAFEEHQTTENHKGLGIIEMPFSEQSPQNKVNGNFENANTPETETPERNSSLMRFICNKCNKSFPTKTSMKRHQVIHSQNRPYKCNICPAAFKLKSILTIHKVSHTGERSFKCHKCPKSFLHKHTLTAHLRWHDGLKPYLCSICKKSFSQLGALREHKRIHTGERPFVCLICGTSFRTSSQCRTHQKVHQHKEKRQPIGEVKVKTSETNHSCKFCGKQFSHRSAMTKHQRTHTGEKPYSCHLCPKRFADPSNFKKHKKFHAMEGERPKAKATSLLKQKLTQVSSNSDPDPDGLLSICSTPSDKIIPPNRSLGDMLEDDNDGRAWGLLRESSDPVITEIHNQEFELVQPHQPAAISNQLVCISYQDPMNPVSSKTTFYVVN